MGFLDNTSITVDAILTKKGRELLARGDGSFKVAKFSLADDEIDYKLWDTAHPNGSNYYGAVIENMPILEAFTDQNQVMRYKLITLNKNTTRMPILNLSVQNTELTYGGPEVPIVAQSTNSGDTTFTFELNDTDVAYIIPVVNGLASLTSAAQSKQDDERTAVVVAASEIRLQTKSLRVSKSARLTVIGDQTGVTKSITLTTLADPNF
jgi:hypothetical protein|tara:strand:- start:42 stop:665 length:624 start_codon:yes stop_codon:yes gene_type:complete